MRAVYNTRHRTSGSGTGGARGPSAAICAGALPDLPSSCCPTARSVGLRQAHHTDTRLFEVVIPGPQARTTLRNWGAWASSLRARWGDAFPAGAAHEKCLPCPILTSRLHAERRTLRCRRPAGTTLSSAPRDGHNGHLSTSGHSQPPSPSRHRRARRRCCTAGARQRHARARAGRPSRWRRESEGARCGRQGRHCR